MSSPDLWYNLPNMSDLTPTQLAAAIAMAVEVEKALSGVGERDRLQTSWRQFCDTLEYQWRDAA